MIGDRTKWTNAGIPAQRVRGDLDRGFELLRGQGLPDDLLDQETIWQERYGLKMEYPKTTAKRLGELKPIRKQL